MPRVEEFLNNGLVTSRDPALLSPGELVQAKNGVYLPNSDTLQRFLGRAAWASVSAGEDVSGLTDAKFRDGTHYVIAQAADRYWIMDAESDAPVPVPLSATTDFVDSPYFVAYSDLRVTNRQVYVQKFDGSGVAQWTTDGVLVSASTTSGNRTVKLVSAGDGGCFVAYTDNRGGTREDIYIQRLNSAGVPQWTTSGVLLCNAAVGGAARQVEAICLDGQGGAAVIWSDTRGSSSFDVFVQRVDSSGAVQWTANGLQLGDAANDRFPEIISDGETGFYATWNDSVGTSQITRITAAGVGSSGWALTGTPIESSGAIVELYRARMVRTTTGVFVCFRLASGSSGQIRLQFFTAAGAATLGTSGTHLNPGTAAAEGPPCICSDEADGAIIAWSSNSGGTTYFMRASRVDSTGTKLWGADGVLVRAAGSDVIDVPTTPPSNIEAQPHTVVSDGSGGAVVTWSQSPVTPNALGYGVVAMRVNAAGALAWTTPYTIVSDTTNNQRYPHACTDGQGGIYASWLDARSTTTIFMQRVSNSGIAAFTANGLAVESNAAGSDTLNLYTHDIAYGGVQAEAVTEGGQLVTVMDQNKAYLLNGATRNRVLLSDGTTRQHGMLPVITQPKLVTATGSWSASATGFFEYWITEVYKTTASAEGGSADAPFTMESEFRADTATIEVTGTNQAVRVYLPHPQNVSFPSGTLFYRIYRTAGPKLTIDQKVYPTGIRVSNDIAVGTTDYFEDGVAATTGFLFPTVVDSFNSWTNPNNLLADDGASATTSGVTYGEDHFARVVLRDFSLTANDPISGIEIQIQGSHSGDRPILFVEFSLDAGATWSRQSNVTPESTVAGSPSTVTGGSPTNTWGVFPTSVGLSNANFRVRLTASTSDAYHGVGFTIDYLAVKVHYNGLRIKDSTPYNAVVIQVEGQTASTGADGYPPIASCGDVFDGSLVTDDTGNLGVLCYYKPGDPEAQPSLYRLRPPAGDNGPIKGIKTVSNRLVVGTGEKLYRVNFLPTQDDDIFNSGRAIDELSDTHGIVRPTCICLFTSPEGKQEAAFVSTNGIFATDGNSIRDLSMDIAWNDLYPLATTDSVYVNSIALKNDPDLKCLLYVTNSGTYPISYAPRHQKPVTGVKWSGPVVTNNSISGSAGTLKSAHIIRRATGFWRQLWGYGGTVGGGAGQIWIGDFYTYELGYTIPHTTSNDKLVARSRDLYLAGRGGSFPVNDIGVYGNQGTYGTVPNGTLSIISLYTNAASATASGTVTGTGTSLLQTPFGSINADAINITYTASGNGRYGIVSFILNTGEPSETALRA